MMLLSFYVVVYTTFSVVATMQPKPKKTLCNIFCERRYYIIVILGKIKPNTNLDKIDKNTNPFVSKNVCFRPALLTIVCLHTQQCENVTNKTLQAIIPFLGNHLVSDTFLQGSGFDDTNV